MKFKQGYMIASGDAVNHYIDSAVKHVKLRQGVLGIKVKIMLPHDPTGQIGPKMPLPDKVEILEPKQYKEYPTPIGIPMGIQAQEMEEQPAEAGDYEQTAGGVLPEDGAAQEYGQPPAQDYRQQPEASQPQMEYQAPGW